MVNETQAPDRNAADTASVAGEQLPRPWGFWTTSAWVLFTFLLAGVVVFGAVSRLGSGSPVELEIEQDPWFPLQLIALNLIPIMVLAFAARLAHWPVGLYLGLVRPSRRDLVIGIVALAVLLGALEMLNRVGGQESINPFQTDAYRTARAAGLLSILWLAFVVAAPVGEEIVFRGFMFRGWAASGLGPLLTIVLTSIAFAAAHPQYDWFARFQILCIAALFGWLRWRSGSTLLTIVLHMAINFISTFLAMLKVEGAV